MARLAPPSSAGRRPPVRRSSAGRSGRPAIVHELPQRLRLRLPLLRHPALNTARLCRVIDGLPGVRASRINVGAASLIVEHDGAATSRQAVLDLLGGLTASDLPVRATAEDGRPGVAPLVLRLALLVALPGLPPAVASLVTWATLAPRLLRGVRSLVTGGGEVELLDTAAIALGAARGNLATALTTDLLLAGGDYLEETTERRSGELLEHLLNPNPGPVWVERDTLRQVPFADVAPGDIVVINTGEAIPIDGVVVDGTAQANQSSITGESLPDRKEVGDTVIAGSTVESGRIKVRALRVGDETTTARVSAFIRESLATQSDTERLAEAYANRRVLVTVGLAAATYLFTRDLNRVISVFLIDYSCAVKLSAPVAVKSTMSQGARRGILIKGGPSIERMSQVDTFVFDKTGTLTEGTLVVTDVIPLAPETWPGERLLAMAASIEEHTRHPIADAVVRAARRKAMGHIAHADIDVVVAHGLTTTVGGEEVVVGSRHFLEDHLGLDFGPHEALAATLDLEGKLLLYLAADRRPIGIIALRDALRPDSRATLARLRALGVERLVMLTGDRAARAHALADELGIDETFAELEPEDKAEIIQRLRDEGRRVAFIGDGMNDAPALVTADVGIAMPLGADLARASADIVLLEDSLTALADTREAAQKAIGLIRSNFHAALGVNSALFVAASAGLLPPLAAAVLHNGTTLALLGRALSYTRFPDAPA
ncbi:MAG: heavy metal translocating P-type ATPase [Rhodospirillaceae bacterium]|nr:heavy metal translocating P-type ATPase [Rhodospirillaceae bacterium]